MNAVRERVSPRLLLSGGLAVGGALAMIGAGLPWLTLYAGLQRYTGLIGAYGWVIFSLGAIAIACAFLTIRIRPRWLWAAGTILGIALLAFAAWLVAGLMQFVHRPDAVMLVPRPGPGLYVIAAGAIVIFLASVADRAFDESL